jgi:VWFA-related protein
MKQLVSLLILASFAVSAIIPIQAQTPAQGPADDLQDGRPQKIVSVAFVNTEVLQSQNMKPPTASSNKDQNAPLAPPTRTRAANAGRILTFVVDDGSCSASRVGMVAAQEALEKFVVEQLQPNDLVAIYQTRSGSSILQQYTSDKSQLMRVVKKIRWYPPRGVCANSGSGDFYDRAEVTTGLKYKGNAVEFESEANKVNRVNTENRLRDNQVVGLIGVLRYITRGLQKVPGRKTVFLLSDGIPLLATESQQRGAPGTPALVTLRPGDSVGAMRELIDFANRASVVFNTIDARGIQAPGASAQDDFDNIVGRGGTGNVHGTSIVEANREAATLSAQSGLYSLAEETGGRFYNNANKLDGPMRRALALEKGYYLIGYQPEADTFKSKKFNKIEIKVKRPDVSVRARSGFLGITDEDRRPKKRSGDSELYEAIAAPLPKAGLNVSLTAFFANTPVEGSFVRTLLHVDGEQLTFADEPNGIKKGIFDVVAVTLNEKNEVVDEFNRTHTIRFPEAHLDALKRNGLIYSADIPVKKPGVYNFRVALRDATSKQLGSAGQQIEVPDLKKSKLLVSGLTIGEVGLQDGKPVIPADEKAQNGFSPVASVSHTAIRHFQPGSILGYSYKVYNAELDKSTRQPKLMVQVRLYKDGEVVTDGAAQALKLEAQTDVTRIADYGYLRLQPELTSGDYALQIVISDQSTGETSSQWIDFEVMR